MTEISSAGFRALSDQMVAQFEQVLAENKQLKAQVQALQAQLSIQTSSAPCPRSQSPASDPKNRRTSATRGSKRLAGDFTPIPFDFSDAVLCVTTNPEYVAFGTADARVDLFSATDLINISTYSGHKGAINSIISDHKTGLFASCSGDGSCHIWSYQPSDSLFAPRRRSDDPDAIVSNLILSHHNGPVLCASWLPNDGNLITGSKDCSICFWDVTHSASCQRVENLSGFVICTDSNLFQNNSSVTFGAGLSTGEIVFFDSRTNESCFTLSHAKGQIVSCRFIDDEYPRFISAGTDKSVRDWDLRVQTEAVKAYDVDHVPTKIAVSNKIVVVPCETGRTRIIDLKSSYVNLIDNNPFSYSISSAAFLSDQKNRVVLASWDGSATIANLFF